MNRIYILTLGTGLFILLAGLTLQSPQSTGAPASSTGAPDEISCAASGCHDTYPLNSGSEVAMVHFGQMQNLYTPGQTYSMDINIEDVGVDRFGFQIVALDENNNQAGSFQVTDADRTQLIQNPTTLTDREYVTYTFDGTAAQTTGESSWSFDWVAPSMDVGAIKFYIATVSADNDFTDSGDRVALQELEIAPSLASTTTSISKKEYSLQLLSNPTSNEIRFNLNLPSAGKTTLQLFDLQGKKVQNWNLGLLSAGLHNLQQPLDDSVIAGIYHLRVQSGKFVSTKSLIIRH